MKKKILHNYFVWTILEDLTRTHSLTRTCIDLDVDLSQASKWLKRLEKELKVALIDRQARPLDLTDFGKENLSLIRQMLNGLRQIETNAELLSRKGKRLVRLGLPTEMMTHYVLEILEHFEKSHQEMQFEIIEGITTDSILEGEVDIAFLPFLVNDPRLDFFPIGSARTFLVAAPSYLQKHQPLESVQDLKKHSIILRKSPNYPRAIYLYNGNERFDLTSGTQVNQLDKAQKFAKGWIPPKFVFREGASMLVSALMGQGIAADLPPSFMFEELKKGNLRIILSGWHREDWTTGLVTRKKEVHKEVSELVVYLQKEIAELTEYFEKTFSLTDQFSIAKNSKASQKEN